MTAGVAAPLVGRNCVGDMCHCSNSTTLHLLLAPAVPSGGIPLFGQGDDRQVYARRRRTCKLPRILPALEIVLTVEITSSREQCAGGTRNLFAAGHSRGYAALLSFVASVSRYFSP